MLDVIDFLLRTPPAPLPVLAEGTMMTAEGATLYQQACAACHGPEGKGNKAMNAPPIGMLQSWYVETQLKKFRGGVRGAHPDDKTGQQMAPMARTIPSDEAVTDLSAYVSSL